MAGVNVEPDTQRLRGTALYASRRSA
jgi:hypothetical protein